MLITNNNDEIFFKIFRNIYLKSKLFYHLKLFNIYYGCRYFKSVHSLLEFPYLDYLYEVEVKGEGNEVLDCNLLPSNIESIKQSVYSKDFQIILSSNIKKVDLKDLSLKKDSYFRSIFNSSVSLSDCSGSTSIRLNSIPDLYFNKGGRLNFGINLVELEIDIYETIKDGYLPKQLKKLSLVSRRDVKIESNALPITLEEFYLFFDDIPETDQEDEFPLIKSDYIENLINLKKFTLDYNEYVQNIISNDYKLPDSITDLTFFVETLPENFKYPSKLVKLRTLKSNFINTTTDQSIIPESCTSLKIKYGFNKTLKKEMFNNNSGVVNSSGDGGNLKYLVLDEEIDYFVFNNGGKSLIQENLFSNSLTYLDFGNAFNQVISVKCIPGSLKKLMFGYSFSKEIIDGYLPVQLEFLEIKNSRYDKFIPISNENQNTIVNCSNFYKQFESCPEIMKSLIIVNSYFGTQKEIDLKSILRNKINLKYLEFDFSFNQDINNQHLPLNNKIETLVINQLFNKDLNLNYFPNLKTLILNNDNKLNIIINNKNKLEYIKIPSNNSNLLNSINKDLLKYIKLI